MMNIAVEAGGAPARVCGRPRVRLHSRLDKRIMAADPFGSRERYGQFVIVQHAFHRDIDALYDNTELDRLLPDLAGRRRLPHITQDLSDLGLAALQFDTAACLRQWCHDRYADGSQAGSVWPRVPISAPPFC